MEDYFELKRSLSRWRAIACVAICVAGVSLGVGVFFFNEALAEARGNLQLEREVESLEAKLSK